MLMRAMSMMVFLGCAAATSAAPFPDPQGDTSDPLQQGPPFQDIASADVTVGPGHFCFTITFHNTFAPPGSLDEDALYGFIDIDADQNGATGQGPQQSINDAFFPQDEDFGSDYIIDFYQALDTPGFFRMYDTTGNTPPVDIPFTTTATSVSGCLMGEDVPFDGPVDVAVLMGTFLQSTDSLNPSMTSCPPPSAADFNGDGFVNGADLATLLASFGPCGMPCPPSCAADLNGDCIVNGADLAELLANWTG